MGASILAIVALLAWFVLLPLLAWIADGWAMTGKYDSLNKCIEWWYLLTMGHGS